LESKSFNLYATQDKKIDVLARQENETEVHWDVKKGGEAFVQQVDRRLVVTNVSQLASSYAWYALTKEGRRVYRSERVFFHLGSHPVLTLEIPPSEINGYREGTPILRAGYQDNYRVCFRYSGIPLPKIYLHKLTGTPFSMRVSESCWEIYSADYEDSGYYVLEAYNCFNSSFLHFRVEVVGKPRVTMLFHNATGVLSIIRPKVSSLSMMVNGSLILRYTVGGNPKPSFEWFHNGSLISISNYNESTLTLRNMKPSDTGMYVLVAHNIHGQENQSFWLSVRDLELPGPGDEQASFAVSRVPFPVSSTKSSYATIVFANTTQTFKILNCSERSSDDTCRDKSKFPWRSVVLPVCGILIGGIVILVFVIFIFWCHKGNENSPTMISGQTEESKPNRPRETEIILSELQPKSKIRFDTAGCELGDSLDYDHLTPEKDKDNETIHLSAGCPYVIESREEKTLHYADLQLAKRASGEVLSPRPRYGAVEYSKVTFL
jgi:hypothetical protein